MITLKVMLVCSLLVAIQCEDPVEKKDEPKDKPTDPPKTTPTTTTTTTTTTEKPKMDEPSSTTPSTTTTSTTTTTTTAVPTAAPAAVPPAINNQPYPPYSPFGFYPGFYPGFQAPPPQVVPSLGVRFNLDATTELPQDPLKPQVPVQSYAGVFPIRQNPFPNNPFLNSLPGRGVSAYSGTFSG